MESSSSSADGASPPTILQILPSLVTGGVERGAVEVARAITEAGWRALVASSGGQMVAEISRAGATHIDFPAATKNPLEMWRNVSKLAALIEQHEVDIVHARSRAPAWSALYAAKRTGATFMTTFHGNYNVGNPAKQFYNSVMARGERVIAISEFIAEQVRDRYGADPSRIRVVPRGVDVDIFSPAAVSAQRVIQLAEQWRIPDTARVVMLPGRLTRWKGQTVLIEALSRLADRTDLRCLIVGGDQRTGYREELERQVSRSGLEPYVQFTGDCRDMPAAFMLADVVVSASTDAEAFGRVIVEAQAMGRPVIATDHGAARETVIEGETGWLVPPGDASALVAALEQALALDPDAREAMAARSMERVHRDYTRELMCDRTLSVYEELLAERAAR